MKAVIVGGVAGGAAAAARIRRLDEHAQIVMVERSGYEAWLAFLLCTTVTRTHCILRSVSR